MSCYVGKMMPMRTSVNKKCLISGVAGLSLVALVSAAFAERLFVLPFAEVAYLWKEAASKAGDSVVRFCSGQTISPLCLCVSTVTVSFLIYVWHFIFIARINRVKQLTDLGYRTDPHLTRRDAANMARKMKAVGDVPPVYPNGWYGVLESFSLKKAEAKYMSIIGQNFALFRGENGDAHVLDAYCPHLGANMAIGGRVFGNCIECPFHGWRFRGDDGKCTSIPYSDGKIPEVAKVKSWPVVEMNGWIYVWFHAEGAEPYWIIPEIPEISSGKWTYRGRTEHTINAHIQEIPENGADIAHLNLVHAPIIPAGSDLKDMWNSRLWSFAKHEWDASWEQLSEPDKHIGELKLTHTIRVFGFRIPLLDMEVTARQIGPSVVYLEFDSLFGRGVFVQSLNPVEPLVQKMIHTCYADSKMPMFIAKIFLMGEALQIDRDVMIWNNKKYEGRPIFVKSREDSQVARHRRWYSQFYSENSPRIKFQKDTLDF